MDNVTHTLIGVGLARMLPEKLQRPAFYWAAVIGNNFPDSDFLQKALPSTTQLDYLVHHRGYTHTFLAAVPLGLVVAAIAKKIGKEKTWDPWLIAVSVFACVLHIAADFMNNYGVHPLTPFYNRWFYGDSVFILEPLIWISLIPLAALTAKRRWAGFVWWGLLVLLMGLVWTSPLLLKRIMVTTTLFAVLIVGLQYWLRSRIVGIGAFCFIVTFFFSASAYTKQEITEAWEQNKKENEILLDIDAVPAPGNPICWRSWISSKDGDHYSSKLVAVSLWPRKIPTEKCLSDREQPKDAVLTKLDLKPTQQVRWVAEVRQPIFAFEKMRAESCTFRKLLNFARYPFIAAQTDGSYIVGDLRYDRETGLGFTESQVRLPENCTEADESSPWSPPFFRNMN